MSPRRRRLAAQGAPRKANASSQAQINAIKLMGRSRRGRMVIGGCVGGLPTVDRAVVVTLRVDLDEVEPFSASGSGDIEQLASVGAPLQANVTV